MRYKLTSQAEADLLEIWRYTAKTWGKTQADRYFGKIEDCFKNIAADKARSKPPLAVFWTIK
jgi:toxin ParE1/3/4